jgi:BASS family bile acid:Na+ symporter
MAVRKLAPGPAAWLEPRLARVGGAMLLVLVALALIDIWKPVITAGLRGTLAIVLVTALATAAGHLLGGPDPATRTATAVSSAARNPGLALLVATLNNAQPAVIATVLAYLVIAALTLIPYVVWRKRVGRTEP